MKRPVAASVALAIVLMGVGAYVRLSGRDSDVATYDPSEITHSVEVSDVATSNVPDVTPPTPAQDTRRPALSPNDKSAGQFPPTAKNIGLRQELSTHDFSVYLVFLSASDSAEIIESTGTLKDEMGIRALQQEYDLNEEELRKLIEYSKTVAQSDREYQAKLQGAACAERTRFVSLAQFGEAVNEVTRNTRTNQETLARQGESALGQALFSKISAQVRSRPPPELTEVDFPSLLMARDHGLVTEIERFCSYGK